jgi:shikimate kinase
VPFVFITGISGSGKSAVCDELRRRGFDAHDTDGDDNAVWVNRRTGEAVSASSAPQRSDGFLEEHEWRVVRGKVELLAKLSDDRPVFLCGSVANDREVWDLFSLVVFLAVDEQTLRQRLATRTTNDFGKSPTELQTILGWHKVIEPEYRRFGAIVVDATLPLGQVVDQVLAAATTRSE